MNGFYLIPANSKKSMLIFGLLQKIDLIIFGIGLGLSLILLLVMPLENIWAAVVAILPGLITGFLVFPVPNYHNMRTILASAYRFFTSNQNYIRKGWCFSNGEDEEHNK